jgi:putative DNA primase/helicase
MAANIFPKITDHSSAFYKRLILIPCDRVFGEEEQIKSLSSDLKKELSGILNWALDGLDRLTKRSMFEQHEFMREAVQELEDENNPVNGFFEEHIVLVMGEEIDKAELYEKYKTWNESTKNYTLSKQKFAQCVFKKYHKTTPKDSRQPNNGKRVWKNLSYVHFKTNAIPDAGWSDSKTDS